VKFLTEAAGSYTQLIINLQAAHGNVGLWVNPSGQSIELRDSQLLDTAVRSPVVVSIYRCLICLGDLARCVQKSSETVHLPSFQHLQSP
jgi:hypothetical protein